MATIIFDSTRPLVNRTAARRFGAGIPGPAADAYGAVFDVRPPAADELTEPEARAVSEARERAARDARHAGQPAERIEAIAEDAARTAAACMMTLRRSATHTPACESWWAAESARLAVVRDAREFDRRAAESMAVDSMARGFIPADLAETIARTSLVGHPE